MESRVFKEYDQVFQESPLLEYQKDLTSQVINKEALSNLIAEQNTIKIKFSRPLKIVIMGEIKAGKSTLLNALLNAEVAPTDVTETTATLMELIYGEYEQGTIHFTDNNTQVMSIKELYTKLHSHKDDQNYFKGVSHVIAELPIPDLVSYHIIDTPGLGTITEANEQVTLNYIQESDVVIWVINVHHIGQADINDYIEKVSEFGKPIIVVLNRVDEVDENVEMLEEYIFETLDMHVKSVIGMSGLQAYIARKANNEILLRDSGFEKLQQEFDYIRDNVKTVLDESVFSSLESYVDKYKYFHRATLKRLLFMRENNMNFNNGLQDFNKQLIIQISQELHSWTRHSLLEGNKQILISQSSKMGLLNGSGEYKKVIADLEEIISPEQIEEQLKYKLKEIADLFETKWNVHIKEISKKLVDEHIAFEKAQLEEFEQTFSETSAITFGALSKNELGNQMMPATFQGAAVGTVSGAALATYAAILGPAASTVTMGAALGAFIPPLAILGAAIAGGMILVNSSKKKRDAINQVVESIESIRKTIDDTVIPKVIYGFEERSNEVVQSLTSQLHVHQFSKLNEDELLRIIQKLDEYNTRLELVHIDLKQLKV